MPIEPHAAEMASFRRSTHEACLLPKWLRSVAVPREHADPRKWPRSVGPPTNHAHRRNGFVPSKRISGFIPSPLKHIPPKWLVPSIHPRTMPAAENGFVPRNHPWPIPAAGLRPCPEG